MHTKLVTTPREMAQLLLNASALNASAYALAAHETACEQADDDRTRFWSEVCRDLEQLRGLLGRTERRAA